MLKLQKIMLLLSCALCCAAMVWGQDTAPPLGSRPANPPVVPDCPQISITQSGLDDSKILTLKAHVRDTAALLSYSWLTSIGTTLPGQDTSELIIDTKTLALEGVRLAATVTVNGLPPQCPAQESITVDVPRGCMLPIKFDEFLLPDVRDQIPRLDIFANYLHQNPEMRVVIIANSICEDNVLTWAARHKNYLSKVRGIDPQRIVILNGGCFGYRAVTFHFFPAHFVLPPIDLVNPCRPCRAAKRANKKEASKRKAP